MLGNRRLGTTRHRFRIPCRYLTQLYARLKVLSFLEIVAEVGILFDADTVPVDIAGGINGTTADHSGFARHWALFEIFARAAGIIVLILILT